MTKPFVIAVDFDGTLCTDCYPEIGEANVLLFEKLVKMQSSGARLVLWTCREGPKLAEAVRWCKIRGLDFKAVNRNDTHLVLLYGSTPRKIGADIYIDDKAMTPEMFLRED